MSVGGSPLSGFSFPRTPVDDGSDGEGFTVLPDEEVTDFTNSAYARKWKKLMSLHKDLSDLGASDFSPDLPRITVIGGQSAGKSSLVEAVSGIDVPRDSGTCTRCPMECRLFSAAKSWSCMISLRFDHDARGHRVDPATEAYSPILTDKADATILSPHRARDFFKNKTAEEIRFEDPARLKFSKNAILVSLKDPGYTDMAFVDLPGLIQNEDKELIDTVQELVVERIQGRNTIILVAVPMSDDIETVMALRLAREADPNGERTIVAVTKADMMTTGASGLRQRWCNIVSGKDRKHRLRHGYYCVVLPHDEARAAGESRADTQRRARAFFDTEVPWRGVKDRKRFGVDNLVEYVSGLLVRLIEEALPQLRGDINALLRECGDGLRALPPQPQFECDADVSTYIVMRIAEFCTVFKSAVGGDPASPHRDLVHANREHYAKLARDIRETRPDFRPWLDKEQYRDPRTELGAGKESVPMDVRDVKEVIKEVTTWELPGHIPFEATKVLVHRVTQRWTEPSVECFEHVAVNTRRVVDKLVDTYFGQFTNLKEHIRHDTLIHDKFKAVSAAAEESVKIVVKLDTGEPLFTQNSTDLEAETTKWNNQYCTYNNDCYNRALNRSTVIVASETAADNRDAIKLMAGVRAYCEVASKRIIDTVPLTIEHRLVQQLAQGLLGALVSELEREKPEEKRAMLDEDEEVAESRRGFRARKDRLLKIQDRLDRWEADA
ncbi:P-loop containing nucleoside triphosphate hydrolase protein [Schizophyllum amplum]|uniref:P-loop containing nucleoside triphosphate hydrolase protein n=1 Tax=Schizophyllum amplum TaxID=97359 RepID=A0A550BU18_9AGAR|nr:P-loop containing nucleoside triphosphate hydrolase protein [Auriculariopsis ampla]